jgi:hypothetical protein
MARYKHGVSMHAKGYPRLKCGPCRDQLIHRLVAAALIGRDLNKDEEVHHKDADRRNPHWSNLMVMGTKDHGWVSSRQAWYMRDKDKREKAEWDEWMKEKDTEFRDEVSAARADGRAWESTRVDGEMQGEWEARQTRS